MMGEIPQGPALLLISRGQRRLFMSIISTRRIGTTPGDFTDTGDLRLPHEFLKYWLPDFHGCL